MIWVLLQSESPLQHNDPITFFYLSLCFSVTGVFFKKFLKEECICHNCLNCGILRERFGNILKRSFKNHKNSEIAC